MSPLSVKGFRGGQFLLVFQSLSAGYRRGGVSPPKWRWKTWTQEPRPYRVGDKVSAPERKGARDF